jgi:hypothetical protein
LELAEHGILHLSAVDDGQTPFESPCETYIPSKLTEAVDDPLFKLLKLAAPGPDFNVQTPEPIVGVLPPRVLVKVQLSWSGPTVATVGFSFKLTEILAVCGTNASAETTTGFGSFIL